MAIVDLPEGDRGYARVDDAGLLAEMEATEWVGAGVDLVSADGVSTVRPDPILGRGRTASGRWPTGAPEIRRSRPRPPRGGPTAAGGGPRR